MNHFYPRDPVGQINCSSLHYNPNKWISITISMEAEWLIDGRFTPCFHSLSAAEVSAILITRLLLNYSFSLNYIPSLVNGMDVVQLLSCRCSSLSAAARIQTPVRWTAAVFHKYQLSQWNACLQLNYIIEFKILMKAPLSTVWFDLLQFVGSLCKHTYLYACTYVLTN